MLFGKKQGHVLRHLLPPVKWLTVFEQGSCRPFSKTNLRLIFGVTEQGHSEKSCIRKTDTDSLMAGAGKMIRDLTSKLDYFVMSRLCHADYVAETCHDMQTGTQTNVTIHSSSLRVRDTCFQDGL